MELVKNQPANNIKTADVLTKVIKERLYNSEELRKYLKLIKKDDNKKKISKDFEDLLKDLIISCDQYNFEDNIKMHKRLRNFLGYTIYNLNVLKGKLTLPILNLSRGDRSYGMKNAGRIPLKLVYKKLSLLNII